MDCKSSSERIIDQITQVLSVLDKADYTNKLSLFNGSTIGQHVRHIHDFYHCVVRGVERGSLDYCNRERDANIEAEPEFALLLFRKMHETIQDFDVSEEIDVVPDFTDKEVERFSVKSSVGRELMYAYDHAVHHLAIIKMGLRQHFPTKEIDPAVGVAPSTIKFHKSK